MKKQIWVRDRNFYKIFFALALTVAAQNLVAYSVNLADNIMLGAYSENALAGASLANQIQYVLQMAILGVGEGIVVLSSRLWGAKEIDKLGGVVNIGMKFGVIFAAALTFVIFCFPGAVFGLLSNEPAVVAQAADYGRIICWTYIFFAYTNILIAFMRSVQTVRIGFYISAAALLINVLLNYMFIYGNWGAPEMGIKGAAAATLISRIIEACIITVYVFRIDKKVKLAFRAILGKVSKVQLRQFVKIAFPVMLGNVSWGVAMTVQIGFVGHLGTAVIAAYSIATTVFQIVSVVEYGSASAANVLIAKTIGEKDIPRVKLYSRCIQVMFVLIGIVSGVIMFFFRDFIIQAYDISPAAQMYALSFMLIMSLELVGTSYQMAVITGIIRGGGDTKFAFFNDFLFMWCLILPLSGLAAFVWNLSPVWVFFILKSDQLLKCIPAALRVNGNRWIKKFPEETKKKSECPACAADQNSS